LSSDTGKQTAICYSRLKVITTLLEGYDGEVPFHHYLTQVFQKNRNFGSRDRKIYSSWCFAFFRLGKALSNHDFQHRLTVAWYLVHGSEDEIFRFLNKGEIPEGETATTEERLKIISLLYPDFSIHELFPFTHELSDDLLLSDFAGSMLIQPRVWIRIVKGKEMFVESELLENNIQFLKHPSNTNAFSFDSGTKLDQLPSKTKGYFEIQDLSSQIAGSKIPVQASEHWWDCCCGAGGKSLELFDMVPGIRITATDKRSSILKNFRERTKLFSSQLQTTQLNLEEQVNPYFFGAPFDGIIADVPCSGSGTWGRNPESLVYFKESLIAEYSSRQKIIVGNALQFLKPGGKLVYMTCSVFKAENEDVTTWIRSLPGISLENQQMINGTSVFADSMFYGVFVKL